MKIVPTISGLHMITNKEDIECPSCGLVYKFTVFGAQERFIYVTEGELNDQVSLRMVMHKEPHENSYIDCSCNKCHCQFHVYEEDHGTA